MMAGLMVVGHTCDQCVTSGGSRSFKRGRLIERRGTNGRIATAHGLWPCWWLPPPQFLNGEATAPLNPPLHVTL